MAATTTTSKQSASVQLGTDKTEVTDQSESVSVELTSKDTSPAMDSLGPSPQAEEKPTTEATPVDDTAKAEESQSEESQPAPAPTPAPAPASKVTPAPAAPAKAAAPAQSAVNENIQHGKKLCPERDTLSNPRLEKALAKLRTPGSHSPAEVCECQYTFYSVLSKYLVRESEENFIIFFDNLLQYIATHKGTQFAPRVAFQGFELLEDRLTTAQLNEFSILMSLLIDTAEKSTRYATAKRMNWDTIATQLVPGYSDVVLTRLKRYFRV